MFPPASESEVGIPEFSESKSADQQTFYMPRHYLTSSMRICVLVNKHQKYILSDANLGPIYVKICSLAREAFILNGCILNLGPSDSLRVSLSHVCLAATESHVTLKMETNLNKLEWVRGL